MLFHKNRSIRFRDISKAAKVFGRNSQIGLFQHEPIIAEQNKLLLTTEFDRVAFIFHVLPYIWHFPNCKNVHIATRIMSPPPSSHVTSHRVVCVGYKNTVLSAHMLHSAVNAGWLVLFSKNSTVNEYKKKWNFYQNCWKYKRYN